MKTSDHFEEVAGIIGGTGPEATNYFTSLLVKLRGRVNSDQEHIPFLLLNNPQIPDRSGHILYDGESPLPEMIKTGLILKNAGASFLVIPCNTAHVFAADLEKNVGLPLLNMVDTTIEYISKNYRKDTTIGLLATSGTIASKTYEKAIQRLAPEMSLVVPEEKTQTQVMKAIYEIKKISSDEHTFEMLNNAANELIEKGASVIILGCTEIPISLTPEKCQFERIDPMEILAKKVIETTLNSKKGWKQFTTESFPNIPLPRELAR